jgi:hypothetical protein
VIAADPGRSSQLPSRRTSSHPWKRTPSSLAAVLLDGSCEQLAAAAQQMAPAASAPIVDPALALRNRGIAAAGRD